MVRHFWQRGLFLGVTLVAAGIVHAEVQLPAVFTDHAVFQCDQPVPIWGWTAPGEPVTVRFAGQTKTTTTGTEGRWQVSLDPMPASAEPRDLAVNEVRVKDVLVGEVWLCSGQSNMAMALRDSENAAEEIKKADHPRIRLFNVPNRASSQSERTCEAKWDVCSPATAGAFSAVGYFYGRELHRELNVPVGIINSSWSGTPAESWMSPKIIAEESFLKPSLERRDAAAKRPTVKNPQFVPTFLFNGMIAPLIPYGIRGVAWYHGGANSSGRGPIRYRKILPALIRDWRGHWGQGECPFYIVQLTNVGPATDDPNQGGGRTLVREAQLQSLSLTNTGLVVTIDLAADGEKHPRNKLEVGKRLSLLALAKSYGKPVEYSGPIYDGMTVEGAKIRIRFQHVDGGLVTSDGGKLKRFAIAGADKKFAWADAVIDGNTVLVSNPDIAKPVAVRYAWAENPEGCNLVNKAGLPASPFRTDDW